MCAGSETDMVNILLRHEWHMRCVQESLAEREIGTESSPHVRHEVFLSETGARGMRSEENTEGAFLWAPPVVEDSATLTSVFAREPVVEAR